MSARAPAPPARDRGALALALEEAFTATVRLRGGRQAVPDAAAFRDHMKHLFAVAHDEARRAGYDGADIKLGIYAATVLLDETVLNSSQPALTGWSRRPLQEELFGEHLGGEVFFDKLRGLLARPESEDLGDVLEVFQLCLLLGFRGRYTTGGLVGGELERWRAAAADKIARIRGASAGITPAWALPVNESFPLARDPWLRPLAAAAATGGAVALVCWLLLRVSLGSWIDGLRDLGMRP